MNNITGETCPRCGSINTRSKHFTYSKEIRKCIQCNCEYMIYYQRIVQCTKIINQ